MKRGVILNNKLIKEGFLVDPGNKRIGMYDLLIDGEKVIKIEEEINLDSGIEVINAKGKYIVPLYRPSSQSRQYY